MITFAFIIYYESYLTLTQAILFTRQIAKVTGNSSLKGFVGDHDIKSLLVLEHNSWTCFYRVFHQKCFKVWNYYCKINNIIRPKNSLKSLLSPLHFKTLPSRTANYFFLGRDHLTKNINLLLQTRNLSIFVPLLLCRVFSIG